MLGVDDGVGVLIFEWYVAVNVFVARITCVQTDVTRRIKVWRVFQNSNVGSVQSDIAGNVVCLYV